MTAPALSPSAWLRWDVIRDHVARLRPASVLELGMGGGAAGARLAAMTGTYVGFEPDDTARALARTRLPASAEILDELGLPGSRRFELVCAFEVLEHIEDDGAALADWVEWTTPGGHLLVSVPAFASRMGAMDRRVGHHRRYDPDHLTGLLDDAGLVDVDLRLVGFPLGHVLEAGRNTIARLRPDPETSMSERTAQSGRMLQPPDIPWLTERATAPFRAVQRRFPQRGTGIVALARRPA